MKSSDLLAFAKGGALGLWLSGPPMFALGVIGGYTGMIVMGPLAFVAGAWVLWDGARMGKGAGG